MGFLSGLKIVRVCLTVAAPSASTAAIFLYLLCWYYFCLYSEYWHDAFRICSAGIISVPAVEIPIVIVCSESIF